MKRIAVYFAVLVGCLFVGLTTYYLLKNYELIDIKAQTEFDAIYLNKGEESTLEITHERKKTELSFEIEDSSIISFDLETGKIVAKEAGQTKLTIKTENENFGPYEFVVHVGDGSADSPYYVKNENDLKAIGGTRIYSETNKVSWASDAHYTQICDITLTGEWQPLCSDSLFTGSLIGDGECKIYGLSITENKRYAGFFAGLGELARVESLTFVNPKISGQFDFAGVVSAISMASTVTKVEVVGAEISVAPYSILSNNSVRGMFGGIVGATRGAKLSDSAYVERGEISLCSFEGKIELKDGIVMGFVNSDENRNEVISVGGIAGFTYASTIHNTKSNVEFVVSENISTSSKNYVRETSPQKGLCVDFGGTTGLISSDISLTKNEEGQNITIQPLIKNNLAIVLSANKTTSTNGIVGHLPISIQLTGDKQCVWGNYFYSKDGKITQGGSILDYATTIIASETQLKDKNTYKADSEKSWEIGSSGSIWTLNEGEEPKINFITGFVKNSDEYTYKASNLNETYKINSKEDFLKYYNFITNGSLIQKKYYLNQKYVLGTDINLEDLKESISVFVPLGGDKLAFTGSFDGNGKTIAFGESVNFGNSNKSLQFAGLFGQIALDAEVKNLTISGLVIDHAKYAGAVAGINYGMISNVNVEDITILDAKYAGSIVGYNEGEIDGGKVLTTSNNTIEIKDLSTSVYVGTIAGANAGGISSVAVESDFLIEAEKTDNQVKRFIGGLVGYNTGKLYDSYAYNVSISDYSTVEIYIGGLSGVNSGEIELCSVGMGISETTLTIKASTEDGKQVAGGFAGLTSEGSKITKSFANVEITCAKSAGFAPYLFGEVSLSYNNGGLSGNEVAGFAIHMVRNGQSEQAGHITDCYTIANLTSLSEKSKLAGLCLYTRYPAVIEKSIMSASFSIEKGGEAYYESITNTREGYVNFFNSFIRKDKRLGTITNVIINVNEGAEVKNESFGENVKSLFEKSDEKITRTKTLISYNGQKVRYLQEKNITENALKELDFLVDGYSYWKVGEKAVLIGIEGLHGIYQDDSNKTKISIPTPGTFVFDGTEKTAVDEEEADGWVIVDGNKATNAGEYVLKLRLVDQRNTIWEDGTPSYSIKEIKWEIKHLKSNVTPVYAETGKVGDALPEISLGEGNTPGTIEWKEVDKTLVEGEAEYEWIFVPTDSNYETVEGVAKITGIAEITETAT